MMVSSYYYDSPQRPDLPAIFESLNDDTLTTILEFVGRKSYKSFGGSNKRCKEVYLNTSGMTKETFIFGYAPLSIIKDKIERGIKHDDWLSHERVGKGVVLFNRRDVFEWALEERNIHVLKGVCYEAAGGERLDLLKEVWTNMEDDEDNKPYVFEAVNRSAARFGKLNVLEWVESKRLHIDKKICAMLAARFGHIDILKWLKEEKGFQLDGKFYVCAINGNHLHVMKWLKDQEVPFHEWTFKYAAKGANLNILQWLHDESCPWPDNRWHRVYGGDLKPEVIDWCHLNRYSNRIVFGDDDDY